MNRQADLKMSNKAKKWLTTAISCFFLREQDFYWAPDTRRNKGVHTHEMEGGEFKGHKNEIAFNQR